MHKLLVRQFESLEAEKHRRLFPKLSGAYDEQLVNEAGILGVSRRGDRYAIAFERFGRTGGRNLAQMLGGNPRFRVVESKPSAISSRAIGKMTLTKPIGNAREFNFYYAKEMNQISAAIDARSNFIQHFKLLLNEKRFDYRMFAKDPRHREETARIKEEIADIERKIKQNEKSKRSWERRLEQLNPVFTVMVKGHILSFKNWRQALAILEKPLNL